MKWKINKRKRKVVVMDYTLGVNGPPFLNLSHFFLLPTQTKSRLVVFPSTPRYHHSVDWSARPPTAFLAISIQAFDHVSISFCKKYLCRNWINSIVLLLPKWNEFCSERDTIDLNLNFQRWRDDKFPFSVVASWQDLWPPMEHSLIRYRTIVPTGRPSH